MYSVTPVVVMADCSTLLERVTMCRAEEALREVRRHYPLATATTEVSADRGIITVCQDRFVLSKEFVETEASLRSPHCMPEYGRILTGKARLVLVVPKDRAVKARMRLLEFNNFWLFYYQIFYYDVEGNIRRMERKAWCELSGRPYEAPPRSPEIV
jgi:hypothetical protein